ncbi:GFA family protein [Hydrogenophaga soli]
MSPADTPCKPERFTGQCQCGQVVYEVTGQSATLFACHCTECQRQSSSAFGMALWIENPVVQLHQGELAEWVRTTPSGQRLAGRFCPQCGTRLFHQALGQHRFLSIKPGTLDDTRGLSPVGHLWTQSKQAWVQLPEGSLCYAQNPPSFEALIQRWQESRTAPDA